MFSPIDIQVICILFYELEPLVPLHLILVLIYGDVWVTLPILIFLTIMVDNCSYTLLSLKYVPTTISYFISKTFYQTVINDLKFYV